ncbi:CsgG/HfaB family protein [Hydrogenimonas urashimensis]|uniref:CsgG/HfaB family protein n=1 Tax=Hydrogenimonas urashimensis TaxID=2740515 RepID=UPI0019154C9A|nr:CsgG/HfaB family protein [Hydrogenimonas urashimensis]
MKRIWTFVLIMLFVSSLAGAESETENKIPPPPKDALKYTIMVKKFANEAGWRGRWEIGQGMTTVMIDMLNKSGWFTVLGDEEMRKAAMQEQDFAATGRVVQGRKTPKMGRMTPAQLLLRGSITNVQESGSMGGGINFMGVSIGGREGTAEINFTIYLINSETGQVVASKSVVGRSGERGFRLGYYGSALEGLTGSFGGTKKDNVMEAAENALGKALAFIVQQLDKIPWEGHIILMKGDKIIINRGTREGVKVGKVFKIGKVEELVDPDTGEVLDIEMTPVATAKVVKVKKKISYLKPLSGKSKIRRGMSVFPAE